MMVTVYQVDAFRDGKYLGNPAGVCVLRSAAPAGWMQDVARQMGLSETAFLIPRKDGGFDLRWFTPTVEVKLCGHATLASAHLLWEKKQLTAAEPARFHTMSGWLTATKAADQITLDFPAKAALPGEAPSGLLEALGIEKAIFVGRSQFDYLVMIDSAIMLRELEPDFAALLKVPVRGIIVTSASDSAGFSFLSRFFAPASGVNEDPVTGSAHCTLGPFWADRLEKTQFVACQVSHRGGVLGVEVKGNRVLLSGRATTVSERQLHAA